MLGLPIASRSLHLPSSVFCLTACGSQLQNVGRLRHNGLRRSWSLGLSEVPFTFRGGTLAIQNVGEE